MDKEIQFQEQEAPLKNTDGAFVQVSEDGSPSIPETSGEQQQDLQQGDSPTTIERR